MYRETIAGRGQHCRVVRDNRESGVNPEQSCCRDDGVFPCAKAATVQPLEISGRAGRFGKAVMSKSKDLPVKRTDNGSCRSQSFTGYEDFVYGNNQDAMYNIRGIYFRLHNRRSAKPVSSNQGHRQLHLIWRNGLQKS
jgi:hypothetical protein